MEWNNSIKPFKARLKHGTNEEFEEFDPQKIGSNYGSKWGKGAYLTQHEEIAGEYGKNINEYDVDIPNAIYMEDLVNLDPEHALKILFPNSRPSESMIEYIKNKLEKPSRILDVILGTAYDQNIPVNEMLKRLYGGEVGGLIEGKGHEIVVFDPKKMKFVKRYKTNML